VFSTSEKIVLNIYFKNFGDEELDVCVGSEVTEQYSLTVLLPDGQPAPLTLAAKEAMIRRPGGSRFWWRLRREEEFDGDVVLNGEL
jgi:hypothetical protein